LARRADASAPAYEIGVRDELARARYPRLGRRGIDSIDTDDDARLIEELRRAGLSAWTIRGVLTVVGRVLGHAVRRGWIAENATRNLERGERPTVERREMRILDRDEIVRLLDAASPSTARYSQPRS
jgi:integrase